MSHRNHQEHRRRRLAPEYAKFADKLPEACVPLVCAFLGPSTLPADVRTVVPDVPAPPAAPTAPVATTLQQQLSDDAPEHHRLLDVLKNEASNVIYALWLIPKSTRIVVKDFAMVVRACPMTADPRSTASWRVVGEHPFPKLHTWMLPPTRHTVLTGVLITSADDHRTVHVVMMAGRYFGCRFAAFCGTITNRMTLVPSALMQSERPLKKLRVVCDADGHGAFLIAAFDASHNRPKDELWRPTADNWRLWKTLPTGCAITDARALTTDAVLLLAAGAKAVR